MKRMKLGIVSVLVIVLALSFGACSGGGSVTDTIKNDFNAVHEQAKGAISGLTDELGKFEHEASGDLKTSVATIEAELEKIKTALSGDDKKALDVAKEGIAKVEDEFSKIKSKVEELGGEATDEVKAAISKLEEEIKNVKASITK